MKSEEEKIALLYANFRRRRKRSHDWIYLAKKVKELSDYYGSYYDLAKKLGISREAIRETLKLLELPPEVQQLVKEGKLKHEVAWRIASIKDPITQKRVAKEVVGLDTHDGRDIVRIFRKNPKINIEEYVKRFNENKRKIEKINLMIIPLKKEDYNKIKKIALREKKNPEEFVSEKIIHKWLQRKK